MSKLAVVAALVGLAIPSLVVAGSLHQICYHDLTNPLEPHQLSARCRSDLPGVGCTVQVPAGFTLLSSAVSLKGRSETYRVPNPDDTYRLTFHFSDGTARGCTVEMGIPADVWQPPLRAQGTLVGFTTDDSGLLTTGVWNMFQDVAPEALAGSIAMEVPRDFVVTGGGAVGAEFPNGAMLYTISRRHPYDPFWDSMTVQLQSADPYVHESRAIAMKVEGISHDELLAATSYAWAESAAVAAHADISMAAPPGWLAVGGGATIGGPGWPRFLTASAPVVHQVSSCRKVRGCPPPTFAVDGWQAKSKDHVVPAPAYMFAEVYLIAPQLIIGGHRYRVDVAAWAATSAVAQHPSVTVAGAPGTYALTGVGAYVDWEPYGWAGNLLWKVLPLPDIAGAEVASKDHTFASPATVTAYAVGVKLVLIPD